MYERFTDSARKVMQLASQEAKRFGQEEVGSEHILLGLIKQGSNVAVRALMNMDIDLDSLCQEIARVAGQGNHGALPSDLRGKRVIERAIEQSTSFRHLVVSPAHLLLGILGDEQDPAARTLIDLGLNLKVARAIVLAELGPRENVLQQAMAEQLKYDLREYEFLIPLMRENGSPVEREKIAQLKKRLRESFGWFMLSPQRIEGAGKIGNVPLSGEMLSMRVLAELEKRPRKVVSESKEQAKNDVGQEILVVERRAKLL